MIQVAPLPLTGYARNGTAGWGPLKIKDTNDVMKVTKDDVTKDTNYDVMNETKNDVMMKSKDEDMKSYEKL